MFNKIRLFLRQPFTETNSKNEILKIMGILNDYKKYPMKILPYKSAGESEDFKSIFKNETGIPFTPENFRNYRLNNIRKSNSMFIIRNSMSESTAFELGHIYSIYPNLPIFYAVHRNSPIKTTLLQDLHPNVVYYTYKNPEDITPDLYNWLDLIANNNNVMQTGSAHKHEIRNSPARTLSDYEDKNENQKSLEDDIAQVVPVGLRKPYFPN